MEESHIAIDFDVNFGATAPSFAGFEASCDAFGAASAGFGGAGGGDGLSGFGGFGLGASLLPADAPEGRCCTCIADGCPAGDLLEYVGGLAGGIAASPWSFDDSFGGGEADMGVVVASLLESACPEDSACSARMNPQAEEFHPRGVTASSPPPTSLEDLPPGSLAGAAAGAAPVACGEGGDEVRLALRRLRRLEDAAATTLQRLWRRRRRLESGRQEKERPLNPRGGGPPESLRISLEAALRGSHPVPPVRGRRACDESHCDEGAPMPLGSLPLSTDLGQCGRGQDSTIDKLWSQWVPLGTHSIPAQQVLGSSRAPLAATKWPTGPWGGVPVWAATAPERWTLSQRPSGPWPPSVRTKRKTWVKIAPTVTRPRQRARSSMTRQWSARRRTDVAQVQVGRRAQSVRATRPPLRWHWVPKKHQAPPAADVMAATCHIAEPNGLLTEDPLATSEVEEEGLARDHDFNVGGGSGGVGDGGGSAADVGLSNSNGLRSDHQGVAGTLTSAWRHQSWRMGPAGAAVGARWDDWHAGSTLTNHLGSTICSGERSLSRRPKVSGRGRTSSTDADGMWRWDSVEASSVDASLWRRAPSRDDPWWGRWRCRSPSRASPWKSASRWYAGYPKNARCGDTQQPAPSVPNEQRTVCLGEQLEDGVAWCGVVWHQPHENRKRVEMHVEASQCGEELARRRSCAVCVIQRAWRKSWSRLSLEGRIHAPAPRTTDLHRVAALQSHPSRTPFQQERFEKVDLAPHEVAIPRSTTALSEACGGAEGCRDLGWISEPAVEQRCLVPASAPAQGSALPRRASPSGPGLFTDPVRRWGSGARSPPPGCARTARRGVGVSYYPRGSGGGCSASDVDGASTGRPSIQPHAEAEHGGRTHCSRSVRSSSAKARGVKRGVSGGRCWHAAGDTEMTPEALFNLWQ